MELVGRLPLSRTDLSDRRVGALDEGRMVGVPKRGAVRPKRRYRQHTASSKRSMWGSPDFCSV
eukprot:1180140-Prorocentrum_minimum.AAC.10